MVAFVKGVAPELLRDGGRISLQERPPSRGVPKAPANEVLGHLGSPLRSLTRPLDPEEDEEMKVRNHGLKVGGKVFPGGGKHPPPMAAGMDGMLARRGMVAQGENGSAPMTHAAASTSGVPSFFRGLPSTSRPVVGALDMVMKGSSQLAGPSLFKPLGLMPGGVVGVGRSEEDGRD